MNCSQAKRLRKEANYHPSQPRKYDWLTHKVQRPSVNGGMINLTMSQLVINDADPRTLYQELKKEFYAEKRRV